MHRPFLSVRLTPNQEIAVARSFLSTINEHGLDVIAFTICEDHVHVLLGCLPEHIPRAIRLLKARASHTVRKLHPPSDPGIKHLWGEAYHARGINSDRQLDNTIRYIHRNRRRHGLPYNEELEDLFW